MKFSIYVLTHPVTGKIGYVGSTSKTLEIRLGAHLQDRKRGTSKRAVWLRSLPSPPRIVLLERVEGSVAASRREREWIKKYLSEGVKLSNSQCIGQSEVQIGFQIKISLFKRIQREAKRLSKKHGFKVTRSDVVRRMLERGWALR